MKGKNKKGVFIMILQACILTVLGIAIVLAITWCVVSGISWAWKKGEVKTEITTTFGNIKLNDELPIVLIDTIRPPIVVEKPVIHNVEQQKIKDVAKMHTFFITDDLTNDISVIRSSNPDTTLVFQQLQSLYPVKVNFTVIMINDIEFSRILQTDTIRVAYETTQ